MDCLTALGEYSVFNAAQYIEHGLGIDIGVEQREWRVAAKRRIRRLEPVDRFYGGYR